MAISTFIHVLTWLTIGTLCGYGLVTNQIQQTLIAQYISRALYVVLLITGLLIVVHTVAFSPLLVWLKFAFEVATIVLIDMVYTYKRGHSYLKNKMLLSIIFLFAAASILSVILQYLYE